MAEFAGKFTAEVNIEMVLSEGEARALNVISAWDTTRLVAALGTVATVESDDEKSLISFFDSCREMGALLKRVRDGRAVMAGRVIVAPLRSS